MLKERNANRTHAECVWWKFVSILHVVKRISIEFISHFVELCHACKRNSNTIYTAMLWSYTRSENQWFHSFRICCTVYGMCWCAFDMYHWHIGTFTYVHWALQLKTKVTEYYVSVSFAVNVRNEIEFHYEFIIWYLRTKTRKRERIIIKFELSCSVSKRALVLQSKTEKITRNSKEYSVRSMHQYKLDLSSLLFWLLSHWKKWTQKVFSMHSH